MKILFSLAVLLLSLQVQSQDCYSYRGGKLCVPHIGKGNQITWSKGDPTFPVIINKLLNQTANYSGPNCYNTALMISGVLKKDEVRYLSPEEFEYLLKKYFYEISSPVFGDLVVYEANSQRGHVATFLGENLVFHKKSFHKNYLYRITGMEDVGRPEKNEWTPMPWDDFQGVVDENIGKTTKAFYRLRPVPQQDNFTGQDKLWLSLLNHIQSQVIKDGPNWSIGKNMGLITEKTLEKAIPLARKNKAHPFIIAKLTSLKDQVFLALEEMYYSHAHGQDDVDEINSEICFHDNSYTRKLVEKIASLQKKDPTTAFNLVMPRLKASDSKKCEIDLFSLI